MTDRLQKRFLCLFSVLIVAGPTVSRPCQAQMAVPGLNDDDQNETEKAKFAPTLFTDRKTSTTARSFRQEISNGNLTRALSDFERLQAADPQLVVPLTNGAWGPLHLNILHDFKLLPRKTQANLIEESSGAARRRWMEFLAEPDFQQLPYFLQRFPGSDEALHGLLLMSRLLLDRGQEQAASFWLQQVVEVGHPEFAQIAQKQLARLDVTRNKTRDSDTSENSGDHTERRAIPEFVNWRYRPLIARELVHQIRDFRRQELQAGFVAESTWIPAFDENRIYQKTMRGVAGLDLETGEPSWHFPTPPTIDSKTLLNGLNHSVSPLRPVENSLNALERSPFADVFCRDEVSTRPAAANHRVFIVATDNDAEVPVVYNSQAFGGFSRNITPFKPGQMIALDGVTGRRIWTISQAALKRNLGPGDGKVWFYGAPCVAQHALFCIFEWEGEIRLGTFSPSTGEYLASRVISIPEQTIDKDPVRQKWACTPVRSGGLLWTTTSTGWTLCLDEMTLSVLWASRLEEESGLRSTTNVPRGRVAAVTAALPLAKRWNRSTLHLMNNRVLILSQEAYEAILVNSNTGEHVKSIPMTKALLLHADSERFVIYHDNTTKCYSGKTGEILWEKKLSAPMGTLAVRPAGKGVVRDGMLLLPMVNGHLAAVDLTSGDLKWGDKPLLPAEGWGSLMTLPDGEMLYAAADLVLKLSASATTRPATEHLQSALDLVADGETAEALQEVRRVRASDRDFQEARQLEFQCLLQLARSGSPEYMNQLKETSETDLQKAQQLMLESRLLTSTNQNADAAKVLCDILKQSALVLDRPLDSVLLEGTVIQKIRSPSGKIQEEKVNLTISAWALASLSDLLSSTDKSDWPLEDLNSLPLARLRGLQSPQAAKLITERISSADSHQLAFELLQHSVRLAVKNGINDAAHFSDEVIALEQIIKNAVPKKDEKASKFVRHLIGVAVSEMPAPFVQAVKKSQLFDRLSVPWASDSRSKFAAVQKDGFDQWGTGEWSVAPVRLRDSNGYPQRMSGIAVVGALKDPFLNQYQWDASSTSSPRLLVSSAMDGGPPFWSLSLGQKSANSYFYYGSSNDHRAYRDGSTVVMVRDDLIIGISVLDREVLWKIAIPRTAMYPSRHTFRNFNVSTTTKPGVRLSSGIRLLSLQEGRIALQWRDRIESRDLLTGNQVWQIGPSPLLLSVAAGPDASLLFLGTKGKALQVDLLSGKVLDTHLSAQEQSEIIHSYGDEIVLWKNQYRDGPALKWLNPKDGEVLREVPMQQFKTFQFVGTECLAGISDTGDIRLVELESGKFQDYHVPFSNAKPIQSRQKVIVANDHYLYVGHPTMVANSTRQSSSFGDMLMFDKKLFVLDRHSGKILNTVRSDELAVMISRTSQFPVILIAESIEPTKQNSPVRLRCYDVSGKKQLCESVISGNYGPMRYSYQVNRLRSLDLAIRGSSYRIQAATETATETED